MWRRGSERKERRRTSPHAREIVGQLDSAQISAAAEAARVAAERFARPDGLQMQKPIHRGMKNPKILSQHAPGQMAACTLESTLVKPRIHAAERKQFLVLPALHDPPAIQHQDLIGVPHRR